jgi:inhibitor of KinA sporulation pathway (predicted exonuclease)
VSYIYMLFIVLPPLIHVGTFNTMEQCRAEAKILKSLAPRYQTIECAKVPIIKEKI